MNKYRPHYFSIIFLFITITLKSNLLFAQTTYTWNVANGNFLDSSSWTPSRTTPLTNDILEFDGSTQSSPVVNNIRSQSIGRLRLINNVNVTFSNAIPDTGSGIISRSGTTVTGTTTLFTTQLRSGDQLFTLSPYTWLGEVSAISSDLSMTMGSAGTLASVSYLIFPRLICKSTSTSIPSFEITNGSTLNINCDSPALAIFVDTGSFASISGLIQMGGRGKLYGNDTNSFKVKNLGEIKTSSAFLGNIFGLVGTANIATFDSGAVFHHIGGGNPFGLSSPNSKVTFYTGSTYLFESTAGTPSFSGRTYSNFIFHSPNTYSVTGSATTSVDNIEVDSGSFTIALTGTFNIKGNITVNASGTFLMNDANGSPNYIFKGTSLQTINGSGSLSINTTSTSVCILTLSNINGLQLNRSIGIGRGELVLDTGALDLNGNTLTIGNDSANYGSLIVHKGYLTGSGTLKKWFTRSHNYSITSDTSRFPFATSSTTRRDLWFSGTPSSAGTISVSHSNVSGNSTFGTPFSDNATNAVTVNVRQNSNWTVSTANGFAGSTFALRVLGTATAFQVTNKTNLRLTLASGIAPGTAADGGGTDTTPQVNRTALSASDLNNTFYIGGNSTLNPLPVKLTNFNATALDDKRVSIEWKSSTEINVDRYEIEKSINGISFQKLTSVKSSGNSTTVTSYASIDMDAFNNSKLVYYRLKMIDRDGSFEYSKIVSVSKKVLNAFDIVDVSPNPTRDNITLNISNSQNQKVKIEVIDMNGVIMFSSENILTTGKNSLNINLNTLHTGIFFLRVTSENDVKYFKIMKI